MITQRYNNLSNNNNTNTTNIINDSEIAVTDALKASQLATIIIKNRLIDKSSSSVIVQIETRNLSPAHSFSTLIFPPQ